jgi:protein-L-isoaspartate(D-aspartate) O-methyltransferase
VKGGRRPALLATLVLLIWLPAPLGAASSPEEMLERQLQARGIRDERLLEAFRRVSREAFAPAPARERAYDDAPLPIGHGQTMSQPYMVALMTEQLGLRGPERVLEVGTGSGYHAAILASLAREVYTIEIVPELAASARLRLAREGFRNVHVKQGDGALGWREYGPYDAIVVTAAAPSVPRALIDQLSDGGVLVMPLGDPNGRQVLVRGVKRGTKLRTREITEVRFVPLTGSGARGGAQRPPTDRPRAVDRDGAERVRPPDDERVRQPDDEPARHREEEERARRRDDERRDEGEPARPRADYERERPPARDLNEEELPARDVPDPESDTRSLPNERTRAARAPSAPDNGRRCAVDAAATATVRCRAAGRRFAA